MSISNINEYELVDWLMKNLALTVEETGYGHGVYVRLKIKAVGLPNSWYEIDSVEISIPEHQDYRS